MSDQRIKVRPDLCAYADAGHTKLTIEVTIPGVAQQDIDLKMHEDSFYLSAPFRDTEYVAGYSFFWPVSPAKAEASYSNGLLTIEVPFKDPMEDFIKVAVKSEKLAAKSEKVALKSK